MTTSGRHLVKRANKWAAFSLHAVLLAGRHATRYPDSVRRMATTSLAGCMVVAIAVLGGFANGACDDHTCSDCIDGTPATLDLACSPSDLANVAVAGPCSASWGGTAGVRVSGEDAGNCHVTLTFASGFVFSTDITFTVTGTCTPCARTVAPTQASIPVPNPQSTCADAATLEDAGDE